MQSKTYMTQKSFSLVTDGQRRITLGSDVKTPKRYMVYLVQAKTSERNYDYWICGGAIVSSWYILTSAACVEDVQNMYAISGTMKYISAGNINTNECTKITKRKISFTCVPSEYKLVFEEIKQWSYNDIALVKVNEEYKFEDPAHNNFCDHRPNAIAINFDLANENTGRDVIALGYGHSSDWRLPSTADDFNQPMLRYATTKIYDTTKCKDAFKKPDLNVNIDKFMICTNEAGNIDAEGKKVQRRSRTNRTGNNTVISRRQGGICQNDHGGPLVAWINNVETLLGVASVFRVTKGRKCTGPYLYTSTARNKLFIECLLDESPVRRSQCKQPESVLGFKIIRRYVTYSEDDTEILDNVKIKIRPQINMNLLKHWNKRKYNNK